MPYFLHHKVHGQKIGSTPHGFFLSLLRTFTFVLKGSTLWLLFGTSEVPASLVLHILEHEPCDTWIQLRWLLNENGWERLGKGVIPVLGKSEQDGEISPH